MWQVAGRAGTFLTPIRARAGKTDITIESKKEDIYKSSKTTVTTCPTCHIREPSQSPITDFRAPTLVYNAAKEDPYRLKRKCVRGGSWKDPESMIRSAWRSWEYQNQPRSYVGFRCVRSLATTSSTKQKSTSKRKK